MRTKSWPQNGADIIGFIHTVFVIHSNLKIYAKLMENAKHNLILQKCLSDWNGNVHNLVGH